MLFYKFLIRVINLFMVSAKEERFYDLFVEMAEFANQAAILMVDLVTNYDNLPVKVKAFEDIEHKCDAKVHETMEQLNKSFITPIDREDINLIAKEIDNIVDLIDSTAHRFIMFNITSIKSDALEFAKLIDQCTKELLNVMIELKNIKKSKTLKEKIIEVNRIENLGDALYRKSMTELFSGEKDAVEIIKWKELYQNLENSLDACEDVANLVEGVVMKNV